MARVPLDKEAQRAHKTPKGRYTTIEPNEEHP